MFCDQHRINTANNGNKLKKETKNPILVNDVPPKVHSIHLSGVTLRCEPHDVDISSQNIGSWLKQQGLCKVALCDSCGWLQGHSLHHEALVSFSQAKEAFAKQMEEFQARVSTITPLLAQSGDKVESVVRGTLNQNQSILHYLIGDLIKQSGTRLQQLESSNTVEESLAFDAN
ncbi:hypothetical protein P9112_010506 [Eukaryota sp. TZLM1-RC]